MGAETYYTLIYPVTAYEYVEIKALSQSDAIRKLAIEKNIDESILKGLQSYKEGEE